jgi:hypothetical protein
VQAFRARFQEEGYERYVFIGEAWKGSAGSKLRPSESDSRQEVVFIMAGDVDGALELTTILIERNASNTRSLGEVRGPDNVADRNVGNLMGNLLTESPDLSCLQTRSRRRSLSYNPSTNRQAALIPTSRGLPDETKPHSK